MLVLYSRYIPTHCFIERKVFGHPVTHLVPYTSYKRKTILILFPKRVLAVPLILVPPNDPNGHAVKMGRGNYSSYACNKNAGFILSPY